MPAAFSPGSMTWLLGIEDTCVYPPARFDMAPLDEYELTEHNIRWREDLDAVHELGATALRYGVNWPLVHTAPGVFDWSALDDRLHHAADLGITVIADLVHYGTPTWLEGSFADPRYPDAIAEFAAAFATRYRGLVEHLTPLNEPVTTASFAGLRGVWPPALSGWSGWTTVVLGIVEGVRRTIAAARAANPDVVIVHVEASTIYLPSSPDLEEHADLLSALADLPSELLLGLVDENHPMHAWLLAHGADSAALLRFRLNVPAIDLLGMNYYPDLTPRALVHGVASVEQIAVNRWTDGLRDRLHYFARRYGIPLLVTETSIEGTEGVRTEWLIESARQVLALRNEGLDIRGYTWWPLFDFVDWSYASGGRNVEEFLLAPADGDEHHAAGSEVYADVTAGKSAFLRRMGLLALEERQDGSLRRRPTTAATAFQNLAASEQLDTIGDRVG